LLEKGIYLKNGRRRVLATTYFLKLSLKFLSFVIGFLVRGELKTKPPKKAGTGLW